MTVSLPFVEWGIALKLNNLKLSKLKEQIKNLSIRIKLPLYLLIFVFIIIALLWGVEVIGLDTIYREVKAYQIEEAGKTLVKDVDKKHADKLVEKISRDYNVCVRIYNENGFPIYTASTMDDNCSDKIETSVFLTRLSNATYHDNFYVEENIKEERFLSDISFSEKELKLKYRYSSRFITTLSLSAISQKPKGTYIIFLDTQLTPMFETTNLIRKILNILTWILILLALVLAMFISHIIVKPILELKVQASQLSKDDFNSQEIHGYYEINQLSKTLIKTHEELSQVENLRNELISNVSHDLRTPLTMIGGYAEMMKDLPDENNPENLQVIIDESRRLNQLVNELLDLSRLQQDKTLNLSNYSLNTQLQEIIDRIQALNPDFKFQLELTDDTFVYADQLKISQVLYNLITNAMNYCDDTKTIHIKTKQKEEKICVEIINFGEIIPEDELEHIWQRYYRTKQNHDRSKIGSGIGLNIVKQVLDAHQAAYGVISNQEDGTIFYFELKTTNE